MSIRISRWPLAGVVALLALGIISILIGVLAWASGDQRGIGVLVFGLALLLATIVVDRWYRI